VKRLLGCGVTALALFVTGLTSAAEPPASASEPAAAAPVGSVAAPSTEAAVATSAGPTPEGTTAGQMPSAVATTGQTPLQVRASKPLTLDSAPAGSNVGWKLLGMALVAGAGVWLWKRRPHRSLPAAAPQLAILRRTSLGVRSELILVELEGQRLLLGVTPNSIQNLYIVPTTYADELAAEAEPTAFARRLVGAIEKHESERAEILPTPAASRRTKKAAKSSEPLAPEVEGQARGLLTLGERR